MTNADAMRLDQRLVADGLVATRSRARDLILRGFASINGTVCTRPAQSVPATAAVALADETPAYVSRGAEKLIKALDTFTFDPNGRTMLDAGASTGGFTQVLLSYGARRVYAADVGSGQLHETLRSDPRVVSLEHCDIRDIAQVMIDEPIEAIVADVSFISLTKALPRALDLAVREAFLVALVKPQFELTPSDIAKGGIVRDEASRRRAVANVESFIAATRGWRIVGTIPSPILGGSGNLEFLIGAVKDG